MGRPAKRPDRFFPALPWAFAAAAWLLLAAQAPALVHRLACPQQVQQEEAVNVEFGRVLLRGERLYPDIRVGGPYLHCSYPPLFPFLESLLMRLTPDPWAPGRSLAFAGFLACGLMLGGAVWRRWRDPAWALLLPALLWLSPTWGMWGSMARLDTLLMALDLGAFLLLLPAPGKEKRLPGTGHFAAAGVLNALAILLKPTAATLTLAVAAWAVLRRPGKGTWAFGACALVPVALFTAAAQWATGGLYGLHTLVWASVGFDPARWWAFLSGPFLGEAGWLLGAVALSWRLRGERLPLLLRCQLGVSLLSTASLSRMGSAQNYYMEFILYGLLALGEAWAGGPDRRREGTAARYAPWALLALGLFCAARAPQLPLPSADEMAAKLEMSRLYAGGGAHLALDADLPVLAGARLWYQSSGIMPIAASGDWDPAPLVRDIDEKKFSTIELYDIPQQYLYPPEVVRAASRGYHPVLRRYGRVWLAPNGPNNSPRKPPTR